MTSILKHTTERSCKFTIELRAYDEDPDLSGFRSPLEYAFYETFNGI